MDDARFVALDRPPLSARALRAALTGTYARVEVRTEVDSTNTHLVREALADPAAWPDGSVLIADHQSAGRGRGDHRWAAPPRTSLLASVLWRPAVPPERWGWLPLVAGYATGLALWHLTGVNPILKWPNDLLLEVPGSPDLHGWGQDRKVAGILAEALADGSGVVLGIGVNVDQTLGELPVPWATSLRRAPGAVPQRTVVARAVLRELARTYRAWLEADGDVRAAGLAEPIRRSCATVGSRVLLELPGGRRLTGRALDIDDDGALVVEVDPEPGGAAGVGRPGENGTPVRLEARSMSEVGEPDREPIVESRIENLSFASLSPDAVPSDGTTVASEDSRDSERGTEGRPPSKPQVETIRSASVWHLPPVSRA